MRISDWSSDVCSSDLQDPRHRRRARAVPARRKTVGRRSLRQGHLYPPVRRRGTAQGDDGGRPPSRRRTAHGLSLYEGEPQQRRGLGLRGRARCRSEEHTSELQSLMRISYAVFCLKKKTNVLTASSTRYNAFLYLL